MAGTKLVQQLDEMVHPPEQRARKPADRTKFPKHITIGRRPRANTPQADEWDRVNRLRDCTEHALNEFYAEMFRRPGNSAARFHSGDNGDTPDGRPSVDYGPVPTRTALSACLRQLFKAKEKRERYRALILLGATAVSCAARMEAFGEREH